MHAALISIVLLSGTCGDLPQAESRAAVAEHASSFAGVNGLRQGREDLGISTMGHLFDTQFTLRRAAHDGKIR